VLQDIIEPKLSEFSSPSDGAGLNIL
jgi:hypothetical protein